MTGYIDADADMFSDIVYNASAVARSTWHDGDNRFYKVSDTAEETNIDFLTSSLLDKSEYVSGVYNIFNASLDRILPGRATVIITDLQSDLDNYSSVSDSIVKKVLAADLSIGFIGVELSLGDNRATTLFVLVVCDADNLSKYISNFKNNSTIAAYSGEKHDFQLDTVGKINYQIIANKSGIKGIKYNDIECVENGFYAGLDGNIDVQETLGSFFVPDDEYTEDMMRYECEGTVNFSPNAQRMVNPKAEKIKGSSNPVYIGAKSLVYKSNANDKNVAGKLKYNVPFDVIDGVKLSKLECNISKEVSVSKSGGFKKVDNDDFVVSLADGITPEQGRWRVDDKNNSVVLNIMVPDAKSFAKPNEVIKLDITFEQCDNIDTVSNWIKDWDKRGCKNLINLFNSIYIYQKDANIAKNTVTVYLASGDKNFTRIQEKKVNR